MPSAAVEEWAPDRRPAHEGPSTASSPTRPPSRTSPTPTTALGTDGYEASGVYVEDVQFATMTYAGLFFGMLDPPVAAIPAATLVVYRVLECLVTRMTAAERPLRDSSSVTSPLHIESSHQHDSSRCPHDV
jgi:hypothetical protein